MSLPVRGCLRLNRERGKVFGVCAGLADHFGLDVMLVRLAWVIGTPVRFGSLILIDLAIALIAD